MILNMHGTTIQVVLIDCMLKLNFRLRQMEKTIAIHHWYNLHKITLILYSEVQSYNISSHYFRCNTCTVVEVPPPPSMCKLYLNDTPFHPHV